MSESKLETILRFMDEEHLLVSVDLNDKGDVRGVELAGHRLSQFVLRDYRVGMDCHRCGAFVLLADATIITLPGVGVQQLYFCPECRQWLILSYKEEARNASQTSD